MTATQRDIERLLADIPLDTPQDESKASNMLQTFIGLRNAAFDGAGVAVPGVGISFSIPALIDQLKAGRYGDVATTLVVLTGEVASAFSFLVTSGVEAGAIGGTSALASAGTVAGMIGEAAGPAAIAVATLIATFQIPGDVNENQSKLYFITDASGVLTSWMFSMPEINPHTHLVQRARNGGYCGVDISEVCHEAHRRVHELWRRSYQGHPSARRAARLAAGDNWEEYWLTHGRLLDQRLQPFPTRVGLAWVRQAMNDAKLQIRSAERAAAQRRFQQQLRRAAGGQWVRTPEGSDLFIPDR